MTVPPGFSIRVTNFIENSPYPVKVHLPPINEDDHRIPRLCGPELDLVIPQDEQRHSLLGRFMSSWSLLENVLGAFVAELVETDIHTARYVQSSFGTRQLIDMLKALTALKLSVSHRSMMFNLLERAGKLNGKRNALVHGQWILEVNIYLKFGHAVINPQFVRELTPLDPEIADKVSKPRNQKERVKYVYTLRRIDGAINDTDRLAKDFGAFLQEIRLSPTWREQRANFLSRRTRLDRLWSTYQIDPLQANHATHTIDL